MAQQVSQTGSVGKVKFAVAVLAIAAAGGGAYSLHEHALAKSATAQNSQMLESLKSTNAQVAALTAKLNEMVDSKPDASMPSRVKPTRSRPPVESRSHKTARKAAEDPRWKKIQTQLDSQGKAIDAARQDLDSAKTELGGSIARTHEELVVLQRRGERNYTEFDVEKSKQFSQHGPFGVKLKKANVKDQYADLELMVDDVKLVKKHVNLYEPATFLAADDNQPIQLVINRVTKDHIHGYISAPKYAASELNAMAGNSARDGRSQESAVDKPRQRLVVPQ